MPRSIAPLDPLRVWVVVLAGSRSQYHEWLEEAGRCTWDTYYGATEDGLDAEKIVHALVIRLPGWQRHPLASSRRLALIEARTEMWLRYRPLP